VSGNLVQDARGAHPRQSPSQPEDGSRISTPPSFLQPAPRHQGRRQHERQPGLGRSPGALKTVTIETAGRVTNIDLSELPPAGSTSPRGWTAHRRRHPGLRHLRTPSPRRAAQGRPAWRHQGGGLHTDAGIRVYVTSGRRLRGGLPRVVPVGRQQRRRPPPGPRPPLGWCHHSGPATGP